MTLGVPAMAQKSVVTIAMVCNSSWALSNFRGSIIRALVKKGKRVVALVPEGVGTSKLEALGAEVHRVPISAKGINPISDLWLLVRLVLAYRAIKPNLIFHYTIKPNIYGSLAARSLGIKSIAVVTGLGFVFLNRRFSSFVAKMLYRASLSNASEVWFLNREDGETFVKLGLAKSEACRWLPGEGVDTNHFQPTNSERVAGPFRFLLAARLLWDKGVAEYVSAATQLKARYPEVRFLMLGEEDARNPSAIGAIQMRTWQEQGSVEYLGVANDVRSSLEYADCVVLPSYREGLSRILLEASAMGRPAIASDVPGCREIVRDGSTGYLCKVRDAVDLAAKMECMIRSSQLERARMGAEGRRWVVEQFDDRIVIARYLEAVAQMPAA
jgi:glycosyltransferase involved in cell wall biosynthesis